MADQARAGLANCSLQRPDVCFAFVKRSIIVDHNTNTVHVQSLKGEDSVDGETWLTRVVDLLESTARGQEWHALDLLLIIPQAEAVLQRAVLKVDYTKKIRECQEHIRADDSYELCLTDQTSIKMTHDSERSLSSWKLYNRLRQPNPAPFGAFLNLSRCFPALPRGSCAGRCFSLVHRRVRATYRNWSPYDSSVLSKGQ